MQRSDKETIASFSFVWTQVALQTSGGGWRCSVKVAGFRTWLECSGDVPEQLWDQQLNDCSRRCFWKWFVQTVGGASWQITAVRTGREERLQQLHDGFTWDWKHCVFYDIILPDSQQSLWCSSTNWRRSFPAETHWIWILSTKGLFVLYIKSEKPVAVISKVHTFISHP